MKHRVDVDLRGAVDVKLTCVRFWRCLRRRCLTASKLIPRWVSLSQSLNYGQRGIIKYRQATPWANIACIAPLPSHCMLIFNHARTWITVFSRRGFFLLIDSRLNQLCMPKNKIWIVSVCDRRGMRREGGREAWGCVGVEPLTAAVQISLLTGISQFITTPLWIWVSPICHPQTKPHLHCSCTNPLSPFSSSPPFFFRLLSPRLSAFWSTLTRRPLEVSACEISFITPLGLIPLIFYLWFAPLPSFPPSQPPSFPAYHFILGFLEKHLSVTQWNTTFLKPLSSLGDFNVLRESAVEQIGCLKRNTVSQLHHTAPDLALHFKGVSLWFVSPGNSSQWIWRRLKHTMTCFLRSLIKIQPSINYSLTYLSPSLCLSLSTTCVDEPCNEPTHLQGRPLITCCPVSVCPPCHQVKNVEEQGSIRAAHSASLCPLSRQSNSKPIVTAPFMKHGARVTLLPMLLGSCLPVCVCVCVCVCVWKWVSVCVNACVCTGSSLPMCVCVCVCVCTGGGCDDNDWQ